jgi:signal transduction histidine kinase
MDPDQDQPSNWLAPADPPTGYSALGISREHDHLLLDTANRIALNILGNRTGTEALQHIAEAACDLAGARYAALGVANPEGDGLSEFITTGISAEDEAKIGARPRGAGVLGLLLERKTPLRIDVLSDHPESVGFPPNHPPMKSFLGVPVIHGTRCIGSLYLTDKVGEAAFTDADELVIYALASHAAVAINYMQVIERQQSLVRRLLNAQEEERRAIAYDLHDGLTQYVMAAHAHLQSYQHALASGETERAGREIHQGLTYLLEAVTESRRLVNDMRTLALDDLGLAGAVEQLVNEEKVRAGWTEANVTHNIPTRRFDHSLETAAFRVIQEALTNVRKHAKSKVVRVLLILETGENDEEILTINVRDSGCGFATDKLHGEFNRVGLRGMIDRVHLMGGEHHLQSEIGVGTVIRASFPIYKPTSQAQSESGDTNA